MIYRFEIPLKLPSLNEYINACRSNKYDASKMKKQIEADIWYFIRQLPAIEKPVRISFTWIEANRKRDIDNVAFAKKFILDALVKFGKLQNDTRKYVVGFTDDFEISKEYKIIVKLTEVEP